MAAVALLLLLGIGGFVRWGWNLFKAQARDALNRNAVIQHHIGAIDRMELDTAGTAHAEGDDVFVFRLEGPKGSGVVTAEFVTLDADTEVIASGTLELPGDETYDLLEQAPLARSRGAGP